jgi:hypothetical protein
MCKIVVSSDFFEMLSRMSGLSSIFVETCNSDDIEKGIYGKFKGRDVCVDNWVKEICFVYEDENNK